MHDVLLVGIDDGERLASPGIIWKVYGRSWEVLCVGSLTWRQAGSRANKRSHKFVLSGPYFIFVREANRIGKPILWDDIFRFHVQHFFQHGDPAPAISKAILAEESARAKAFLSEVKNARIWSDIRLVSNPARRKKKAILQDDESGSLPPKRSVRLLQREKIAKQQQERSRKAAQVRSG